MNASDIIALHRDLTVAWHAEPPGEQGDGIDALVRANHSRNFALWHEEDIARRDDLGAQRIMAAKRAIDGFNQQRNDFVEQMDRHLVETLRPPTDGVPFNSETPGMMIDRLSILALKAYHMREEAERDDAAAAHRGACAAKVVTIEQQRDHLGEALDGLLAEVAAGTRSFRVYFQFKMYNDATLNPQLRRASTA